MPDTTAAAVWSAKLDASQLPLPRPVVFLPTAQLVLACDGQALYALRADTGVRTWKVDAAAEYLGGCVVAGSVVYLADGIYLRALRLADGTELWRYESSGHRRQNLRPPVLCGDGVVVVDFGGVARGIGASGGRELWVQQATNTLTSDVVTDGQAIYYVGDGTLQSLDARNGAPRWSFAPQDAGRHWGDSNIALAGGWVFATFGQGYALDPATGKPSPKGPSTFQNPPLQPLCAVAVDAAQGIALYGDVAGHAFAHRYWSGLTAFYPDAQGAFQPGTPAGPAWPVWDGRGIVLCVQDKRGGQSLLARLTPDWSAKALRSTVRTTLPQIVVAAPVVANGCTYVLTAGDMPGAGGTFTPQVQALSLPT